MSEEMTVSKLWRTSGRPGKFKDFLDQYNAKKQYNANGGALVVIEEDPIPEPDPIYQVEIIDENDYEQEGDDSDEYASDTDQFFIPPVVTSDSSTGMDTKTLICFGIAGIALGMATVLIIKKIKK